ncbi:hypothetical protein V6S67_07260 [Arthrobacter sp. Soc17.1.1.1]|uniref:hypothetical protein n=1 Tax=Arthrobacter sp. Soc17.1.1.1 TaxID=3121277 RepID=UPI002FE4D76F
MERAVPVPKTSSASCAPQSLTSNKSTTSYTASDYAGMKSIPPTGRSADGDSSVWASSDEKAAHDAGLIPADPSTHASMNGTDPDEIIIGFSDEPPGNPDALQKRVRWATWRVDGG